MEASVFDRPPLILFLCSGIPVKLCRIAHSRRFVTPRGVNLFAHPPARTEQFRPAILSGFSDHGVRDEHFFSLFQVL